MIPALITAVCGLLTTFLGYWWGAQRQRKKHELELLKLESGVRSALEQHDSARLNRELNALRERVRKRTSVRKR